MGAIQKYFSLYFFKKKWRKHNSHNTTSAKSLFPMDKVSVGIGTYGGLNFRWFDKNATVTIGNYCSIAGDVLFLVGGNHYHGRISTFPFQTNVYHQKTENPKKNDIVVEDDVWIGYNALVMPGVTIGKGSVIGARSVVTKDVPPFSVYAGTKVIKKRFPDAVIEKIKDIDFSKIHHEKGDAFEALCQVDVTEENVDQILEAFLK